MRNAFTLAALILASSTAVAGEREAFVRGDETSLLAGPGSGMPETARLRRGTRLRIHHEEGDFYAVQPPAGSISWVRAGYVQFVPERPGGPTVFPVAAVVDANGQAKLKAGKVGDNRPLGVERTAVPDGTLLTIVGQKVEMDGIKWYPVVSTEDDFRYIARNTVELGSPVDSKYVVTSPNNGVIPVAGTTDPAPVASIRGSAPPIGGNWNHPLWVEAQRAERAGEWDRAETVYLSLAREMNKPGGNEKLAEECYARVHDLREKRRRTTGGKTSRIEPNEPLGDGVRRTSAMTASTSTPVKKEAASDDRPRWEGPGMLYPSALRVNSQRLYALQTTGDHVVTYAVPGPRIDLGAASGKPVRLYGTVTPLTGYPGKTVMTVTKVEAGR